MCMCNSVPELLYSILYKRPCTLNKMESERLNSYIADKYAGILTEEDVAYIFDLLVKKLHNNRSEAARRCGLTGKATYDWEEAAYVKLGTKKKVLDASLRENFPETIEYLLGRNTDRSLDLLRTILSTLYANAIEAGSRNEFESPFAKFETIRVRYQGMIKDEIHNEVAEMTSLLRKKASDLGIPLEAKNINEFSAGELIDGIQLIGHLYIENPREAEIFAVRNLGLPADALKPIIQTFRNLCFARRMQTDTFVDLNKTMPRTVDTGEKLYGALKPRFPFAVQPDTTIQQLIDKPTMEKLPYEIASTA